MIVTFSNEPSPYKIEFVKVEGKKNGKIRITFFDDIQTQTVIDELEVSHTNYTATAYDITWVPPPTFMKDGVSVTTTVKNEDKTVNETATLVNISDYVALNLVEIKGYAADSYAYQQS